MGTKLATGILLEASDLLHSLPPNGCPERELSAHRRLDSFYPADIHLPHLLTSLITRYAESLAPVSELCLSPYPRLLSPLLPKYMRIPILALSVRIHILLLFSPQGIFGKL